MNLSHLWVHPFRIARGAILAGVVLFHVVGCSDSSPPPAAKARTAPKEYQSLMELPNRKIVELHNGLIIIVERMPTAPVVSVQAWIKTGSVYEQEHNGAGLSHFLEHLISGGGTSTRTEDESNVILGQIGAQTNAATGLDTVRYHINTAAEYAPEAIDLISDWMLNSLVGQAEYDRERDVIQREFEMGQADAHRIFWKLTQRARYQAHPARHPTIGYLDEFLTVSRDEIYDFYKRMYVPNNTVFVVVGDVDPQTVIDQVTELWADAPRGQLPQLSLPIEPGLTQPQQLVGHADIDRPRLRLAWPGTQLAAPHDYALDLLAQILGQGELSPLVQEVRNRQGLVTSIDSFNLSFAWGEGFFGIDAVTTAEQLEAARTAILEEVNRIKQNGVSEQELNRAKRKTLAHAVYAAQSAQHTAGRLASDFIHFGDPDYLQRYADAIQNITAQQVNAAAQKFLTDDRMITVTLLPTDGEPTLVTRPDDAVDAAALPQQPVDLDNTRLAALLRELESAGDESQGSQIDPVRMITLDNGLRLIVQRNTSLPIVSIRWYHLGGLLGDELGREGIGNAACQMLIKGTDTRTADDIARSLEDLGASLSIGCGNSTYYGFAQCLKDDWSTVLDLTADVLLHPSFDDEQWLRMRPRLLAAIDSQGDSWWGELGETFRAAYFTDHPWSQTILGRRDVVAELSTDDLKRFHQQRFAADQCVLTVFGDIDVDAVEQQVNRLFADMNPTLPESFEPTGTVPPPARLTQHQTGKPLAGVQLGYAPGLARDNPDYGPMLVLTNVLSSFPVGWLEQALRGEGPGLVYAVGARMQTGYVPGYWTVIFNTAPDTAAEAIHRTLAVIDRIRSETMDDATLRRARVAVLVEEALSRQTNGQRAAEAALGELYGVGYDGGTKLLDEIRATDAARISDVAQKYLSHPMGVIITHELLDDADLPSLTGAQVTTP